MCAILPPNQSPPPCYITTGWFLHGLVRGDDEENWARPHDLNNLVYCVSCRMPARSARKVALPSSSSDAFSARFVVEATTGSNKASRRWLSVCPKGISRAPADIQFDITA